MSLRVAGVGLNRAVGQRIGTGAGRPALARARDLACIALSAEQVGAARQALRRTVGYTLTRVQFGRAIGSFQALQHRMADLHVLVESARSRPTWPWRPPRRATRPWAAGRGGARLLRGGADRRRGRDDPAARRDRRDREHDAHRDLKRAHSSALLFGPPSEHVAGSWPCRRIDGSAGGPADAVDDRVPGRADQRGLGQRQPGQVQRAPRPAGQQRGGRPGEQPYGPRAMTGSGGLSSRNRAAARDCAVPRSSGRYWLIRPASSASVRGGSGTPSSAAIRAMSAT